MKRTYTQMADINAPSSCDFNDSDNYERKIYCAAKPAFKFDKTDITTFTSNAYDNNTSFNRFNANFKIPLFISSEQTSPNSNNRNKMFRSIDDAMSYYDQQLNDQNNTDEMNMFTDTFNALNNIKFCDDSDDNTPCTNSHQTQSGSCAYNINNNKNNDIQWQFQQKSKDQHKQQTKQYIFGQNNNGNETDNDQDSDIDLDVNCNKNSNKRHKANNYRPKPVANIAFNKNNKLIGKKRRFAEIQQ